MKRISSLLAVLLLVASIAMVPVSAQDSTSEAESVLNSVITDENASTLDTVLGTATGIYQRAQNIFAARSDEQSPAEHAADLQRTFNQNNKTIQAFVNKRSNASTSADVLKITLTEEDEDSATLYLVADVNGSNYENATVVDSTGRTVDESCTLEDSATRNADSELETFVTTFADPAENVSTKYKSSIAAEYSGQISCSFL